MSTDEKATGDERRKTVRVMKPRCAKADRDYVRMILALSVPVLRCYLRKGKRDSEDMAHEVSWSCQNVEGTGRREVLG